MFIKSNCMCIIVFGGAFRTYLHSRSLSYFSGKFGDVNTPDLSVNTPVHSAQMKDIRQRTYEYDKLKS